MYFFANSLTFSVNILWKRTHFRKISMIIPIPFLKKVSKVSKNRIWTFKISACQNNLPVTLGSSTGTFVLSFNFSLTFQRPRWWVEDALPRTRCSTKNVKRIIMGIHSRKCVSVPSNCATRQISSIVQCRSGR